MAGLCFCFLLLFYFFPSPPIRSGEAFSSVIFSSLSLLLFSFGCSDGMEREACVCDHGFERSDLCGEIVIIIIIKKLGVNGNELEQINYKFLYFTLYSHPPPHSIWLREGECVGTIW